MIILAVVIFAATLLRFFGECVWERTVSAGSFARVALTGAMLVASFFVFA